MALQMRESSNYYGRCIVWGSDDVVIDQKRSIRDETWKLPEIIMSASTDTSIERARDISDALGRAIVIYGEWVKIVGTK